ncbi:RHS repeat-associated core domain-containing protein [Pseudomonas sp. GB2N2]
MPTSKPARIQIIAGDNKSTVLAEMAGSIHHLAYSPYGQRSSRQEVMTHLGFNGELREAKADWYFLGKGYRVYNPRLMRFHSPDRFSPFAKGGFNGYAYCGCEPVMRADPSGEAWFSRVLNVISDKFADYVWPIFSPVGTGSASAGRTATKVSQVEYLQVAVESRNTFSSRPHATAPGRKRAQTKLTWKGPQNHSSSAVTSSSSGTRQTPSVQVTAPTSSPSRAVSRSTSTSSFVSKSSSNSHYSDTSSATTPSSVNISLPSFSSGESGFASMRSDSSLRSNLLNRNNEVRRM